MNRRSVSLVVLIQPMRYTFQDNTKSKLLFLRSFITQSPSILHQSRRPTLCDNPFNFITHIKWSFCLILNLHCYPITLLLIVYIFIKGIILSYTYIYVRNTHNLCNWNVLHIQCWRLFSRSEWWQSNEKHHQRSFDPHLALTVFCYRIICR